MTNDTFPWIFLVSYIIGWLVAFSWLKHQPLFGESKTFPWFRHSHLSQPNESISLGDNNLCRLKREAKQRGEHIVP